MPGAEPFELEGGPRGVLVLHGFTGSTNEVRYFGERLRDKGGYTVIGPSLAGHGTRPEDLDGVRGEDWYRDASAALDRLRSRCAEVAVAGLSMGAVTACLLAARRGPEIRALVAMAPAFRITAVPIALGARVLSLPFATRLYNVMAKKTGPDLRDPGTKATHVHYDWAPTTALRAFFRYVLEARKEVGAIRAPTLILQGAKDLTVPLSAASWLASHVSSDTVELRTFPKSAHVLSIDFERDAVADAAIAFLARHFSARPSEAAKA